MDHRRRVYYGGSYEVAGEAIRPSEIEYYPPPPSPKRKIQVFYLKSPRLAFFTSCLNGFAGNWRLVNVSGYKCSDGRWKMWAEWESPYIKTVGRRVEIYKRLSLLTRFRLWFYSLNRAVDSE